MESNNYIPESVYLIIRQCYEEMGDAMSRMNQVEMGYDKKCMYALNEKGRLKKRMNELKAFLLIYEKQIENV